MKIAIADNDDSLLITKPYNIMSRRGTTVFCGGTDCFSILKNDNHGVWKSEITE